MSLISRLFGRTDPPEVARPPEAAAARAGPPLVALHAAGRPAWTPRDPLALIDAGYARNPVAFRAARLVAESAAAIPLKVATDAGAQATHPLADLLLTPNAAQTGAAFLEALYGGLLTAGDAYVQLTRAADGRPAALHLLRPDRIRVIPDRSGRPEAFLYTVGGASRRLSAQPERPGAPKPVLQLSSLHPGDDHYGLAPLAVAARAIDVHNAAGVWTKALLDNAARPSGAVVYKGADGQGRLSEPQYQRLVEELESHHSGARNAGRPMLLEGGLDWRPMGFSPADMEFQKTKDSAAREIALAFGVPPMLLGLPGDNTYSNYQEANRAFARQTLSPLVAKTAGALEAWLSAAYADRPRLAPDFDALPALEAERDARWRRISEAEFLSAEEKRRWLGLPPRAAHQELAP